LIASLLQKGKIHDLLKELVKNKTKKPETDIFLPNTNVNQDDNDLQILLE